MLESGEPAAKRQKVLPDSKKDLEKAHKEKAKVAAIGVPSPACVPLPSPARAPQRLGLGIDPVESDVPSVMKTEQFPDFGSMGSQTATIGAPVKPTHFNAQNSDWNTYYAELPRYVMKWLPSELLKNGVDITGFGELHHLPPIDIQKNNDTDPAIGGCTAFKETWNIERCLQSLESTGKYSAAGSIWWFDLVGAAVVVQGRTLFVALPDRTAVDAASVLFDEAAFNASDVKKDKRRHDFPGVLPTLCNGLPDAQKALQSKGAIGAPTFKNLPLVAAHPVILAFFEAVLDCMLSPKTSEKLRLKKLFEARVK